MNEHPSLGSRPTIFKTTTIFFDIRFINVLPGPKLMYLPAIPFDQRATAICTDTRAKRERDAPRAFARAATRLRFSIVVPRVNSHAVVFSAATLSVSRSPLRRVSAAVSRELRRTPVAASSAARRDERERADRRAAPRRYRKMVS